MPRILRDNGYSTAAFGKWHLTPDGQQGPAGPFDRWPNGWGFDYFYGFLGGGSSQWDPCSPRTRRSSGPPTATTTKRTRTTSPTRWRTRPSSGCTASGLRTPKKPFFVYFSTGCSHAPHHVAQEWADKYKGQFDQGWDQLREETFARQKELGVIPPDAELTPRDDAFPAWDDVPDKLKPFYARQMEVYAGYSENADHNVGRVIDAIDELGELDNTLVIWIWGDNGASMEGTVTGSFNELTMQNGIPLTDEMQLQLSERYGGTREWSTAIMAPHYGAAWAWAGNTPFQWGKQVGSHLGGTRDPMVVHWPARITDAGGAPLAVHARDRRRADDPRRGRDPGAATVDGIEQEPMHGTSFAALDDRSGRAGAPDAAVLRDDRQPGDVQGRLVAGDEDRAHPVGDHPGVRSAPYAPGVWDPDAGPAELYYLPDDFTQAKDLAAEHPDKVRELKELFWQEAERYKVLPLLATLSTFFGMLPPIAGADDLRVPWRRPERDVRDDPADLQPLLHDHRRPRRARRWRRGRDRGRGRPPRWLHALREDGKLTHTYSMMGVFVFKQVAEEDLPPAR